MRAYKVTIQIRVRDGHEDNVKPMFIAADVRDAISLRFADLADLDGVNWPLRLVREKDVEITRIQGEEAT